MVRLLVTESATGPIRDSVANQAAPSAYGLTAGSAGPRGRRALGPARELEAQRRRGFPASGRL